MASEITADGRVIVPLNITAPCPFMDLRGFSWGTVDKVIHGLQSSEDSEKDEPQEQHTDTEHIPTQQAFLAADSPPSFHSSHRAAVAPPTPDAKAQQTPVPPQLPVPQQLPVQLTEQLIPKTPNPPATFPLAQFQGAYAGNGFNMIFRPLGGTRTKTEDPIFPFEQPLGEDDNILELNLTTEQLTFGPTLGNIPNRGFGTQTDIDLIGFPYIQTVQDVTNPTTGKGDRLPPTDIHFEPGMWLIVPQSHTGPSVVRMASIPHGTTINAQGLIPKKSSTDFGGVPTPLIIDDIDTTPFKIEQNGQKTFFGVKRFESLNTKQPRTFRIPQNLTNFNEFDKGTRRITSEIIKNPNKILQDIVKSQKILESFSFEVATGPPDAKLNGGGTANISFLEGINDKKPIAHAGFMKAKYWVERVEYQVNIPASPVQATFLLWANMPADSTAPTPRFLIRSPPNGVPTRRTISVPGTQIQCSQRVELTFGGLVWPHVSVSTLVPKDPQPFQMT